MWTRIELKTQAKNLLRLNYWMFVIGGIILSVVMSGNISGVGKFEYKFGKKIGSQDEVMRNITNFIWNGDFSSDNIRDSFSEVFKNIAPSAVVSTLIFGGMLIAAIAMLVSLAISICILNPIEVGAKRFFNRSYEARCDMREITYAFKENYVNIVKIMFFKNLFTFLWSLLFVIPGIVKKYEYSMVPYLLSENPDMDMQKAFDESRRMTYGQKWQIFMLDLSFVGWAILSSLTYGILGVFFVSPYNYLTKAGLYRRLRGYNDYQY